MLGLMGKNVTNLDLPICAHVARIFSPRKASATSHCVGVGGGGGDDVDVDVDVGGARGRERDCLVVRESSEETFGAVMKYPDLWV